MKSCMHHLEHLLEFGGIKKDIVPLILSSSALLVSLFDVVPLPFDAAWIAIIPVSYTHLILQNPPLLHHIPQIVV